MSPSTKAYEVSFERSRLDLDVIHAFLSAAYWSAGIPRQVVERAIAGSLAVGCYAPSGAQVGFARLITDHATFGYLADVFVLPEHRGQRLGQRMTRAILDLPEVVGMRRLMLATRDAHSVYAAVGFEQVTDAKPFMQILRRDLYRS
ncbi:MAG: GNAT family N-acetyltransferase [Acidobacteriota bacterium]